MKNGPVSLIVDGDRYLRQADMKRELGRPSTETLRRWKRAGVVRVLERNKKPWLSVEDVLTFLYLNPKTTQELGLFRDSPEGRAYRNAVMRTRNNWSREHATNNGEEWGGYEDAVILAPDRPTDPELSWALGRTISAIGTRRWKLINAEIVA
jgi:hypothetical protein